MPHGSTLPTVPYPIPCIRIPLLQIPCTLTVGSYYYYYFVFIMIIMYLLILLLFTDPTYIDHPGPRPIRIPRNVPSPHFSLESTPESTTPRGQLRCWCNPPC
ncbi:hypothetical protein BDV59DRAFT_31525 [Aspergillus ambiguus]|uniref:uncharacterized protein n=1 Tax=Aspergillus ambiguus TaxID=176160 RepID=UPI003CCCB5FD